MISTGVEEQTAAQGLLGTREGDKSDEAGNQGMTRSRDTHPRRAIIERCSPVRSGHISYLLGELCPQIKAINTVKVSTQ